MALGICVFGLLIAVALLYRLGGVLYEILNEKIDVASKGMEDKP